MARSQPTAPHLHPLLALRAGGFTGAAGRGTWASGPNLSPTRKTQPSLDSSPPDFSFAEPCTVSPTSARGEWVGPAGRTDRETESQRAVLPRVTQLIDRFKPWFVTFQTQVLSSLLFAWASRVRDGPSAGGALRVTELSWSMTIPSPGCFPPLGAGQSSSGLCEEGVTAIPRSQTPAKSLSTLGESRSGRGGSERWGQGLPINIGTPSPQETLPGRKGTRPACAGSAEPPAWDRAAPCFIHAARPACHRPLRPVFSRVGRDAVGGFPGPLFLVIQRAPVGLIREGVTWPNPPTP